MFYVENGSNNKTIPWARLDIFVDLAVSACRLVDPFNGLSGPTDDHANLEYYSDMLQELEVLLYVTMSEWVAKQGDLFQIIGT